MKMDYSHFTPSTYMLHILQNIIAAFNTCTALVDKYHSIAVRKTLALVAGKKANSYNRIVNEKERVSTHSSQWGHWLQSCLVHNVTKIHHYGMFTFNSLVYNIIYCFNFVKIPQARISKQYQQTGTGRSIKNWLLVVQSRHSHLVPHWL